MMLWFYLNELISVKKTSNRVRKITSKTGPRIKPTKPNKFKPPIIPSRVIAGCILAFLPIIMGLTILSTRLIIIAPYNNRPKPLK